MHFLIILLLYNNSNTLQLFNSIIHKIIFILHLCEIIWAFTISVNLSSFSIIMNKNSEMAINLKYI